MIMEGYWGGGGKGFFFSFDKSRNHVINVFESVNGFLPSLVRVVFLITSTLVVVMETVGVVVGASVVLTTSAVLSFANVALVTISFKCEDSCFLAPGIFSRFSSEMALSACAFIKAGWFESCNQSKIHLKKKFR